MHESNTADFGYSTTVALCSSLQVSIKAGGTVTGWCGLSSGRGTAQGDHDFAFTSQGLKPFLTGEVTGMVNVLPEPGTSGSCTNKTNNRFLVTGAIALTHVTQPQHVGICEITNQAC